MVDYIQRTGASETELYLLGIIAIMDESFRDIANTPAAPAVYHTYFEIEAYLDENRLEI